MSTDFINRSDLIRAPDGTTYEIGEVVDILPDGYYRTEGLEERRITGFISGSWRRNADDADTAWFEFDNGHLGRPWLVQKRAPDQDKATDR